MLQKSFLLLPLLLAGGILFSGAWPDSLTPSPGNPPTDFLAQAFRLAADPPQGTLEPAQLLQRAIANLHEERVPWLRTQIRQSMMSAEASFVAEGFLQRGPNHCARLEMKMLTNGEASRLLIVSDGEVLAQERKLRDQPPVVACEKLPSVTGKTAESAALARDAYLAGKGCGGPLALLQQLQTRLHHLKRQTGLLQGHEVVQLSAALNPEPIPGAALSVNSAQSCCVFLDAETLWPQRVEWWGQDRFRCPQRIMQVEYQQPLLNEELPAEECARLFSYELPAGGKTVAQKP